MFCYFAPAPQLTATEAAKIAAEINQQNKKALDDGYNRRLEKAKAKLPKLIDGANRKILKAVSAGDTVAEIYSCWTSYLLAPTMEMRIPEIDLLRTHYAALGYDAYEKQLSGDKRRLRVRWRLYPNQPWN